MELRCSSPQIYKGQPTGRKCSKYLGTFDLLIGKLYCKSCGKSNYYEVITATGLQKSKSL